MTPEDLAEQLLLLAAKRSTETQFGWTHPDCEVLQEAARLVRGEPAPTLPDVPEVVLSE